MHTRYRRVYLHITSFRYIQCSAHCMANSSFAFGNFLGFFFFPNIFNLQLVESADVKSVGYGGQTLCFPGSLAFWARRGAGRPARGAGRRDARAWLPFPPACLVQRLHIQRQLVLLGGVSSPAAATMIPAPAGHPDAWLCTATFLRPSSSQSLAGLFIVWFLSSSAPCGARSLP